VVIGIIADRILLYLQQAMQPKKSIAGKLWRDRKIDIATAAAEPVG
jgi:hypothetical protein